MVHCDAKMTFFFATIRLSFICCSLYFSSDAPIDRSTIWHILVQALLKACCSAVRLLPTKGVITLACKPLYAASPRTTYPSGRASRNCRRRSNQAAAVLSCVLPDETGDDVADATPLVCDIRHVQGVTTLSMASTEERIACVIRSLNTDDAAVYVQDHAVVVVGLLWVTLWHDHLMQLFRLRQRNMPAVTKN